MPAAVTKFIIGGLVSWGLSAALREASPSTDLSRFYKETGIELKSNVTSTDVYYPIIYGKIRLGGNIVFKETAGNNNEYLWLVLNLAEGECSGIDQVDGVDQVWIGDKLYTERGGNASHWFHSGSASQTYDTNLNTAISKWTDNKRYTCYTVHKFTFDRNYFLAEPTINILLKGKLLYDLRRESDESSSTWEEIYWSQNPVLALYDFMTNSRYGRNFDESRFEIQSWKSAANYCDAKEFIINACFKDPRKAEDIQNEILKLFRGHLVWWDGKYHLKYEDMAYEVSSMTINDEHVAQDENTGLALINMRQPGKFETPDGLYVRFYDEENDYNFNRVPIGDETGIMKEITIYGCTNRKQAANIGVYTLERMKLDRTILLIGRDDLIKLEPNDLITLNNTALSISDQTMRVVENSLQFNGLVNLVLAYESSALYDDDYDTDIEDNVYLCDLLNPLDEPPSVSNVSVSESTENYRGRTFTSLNISFDSPLNFPPGWFDHVEVWQSFDDATYYHLFDSSNDFKIFNVLEGQGYYIRLKVVTIHGVKQQDSNDYKIYHLVTGYTDTPSSVASLEAIVNQNSINLYSAKVSDPDIELYEFRLGSSWAGGVFLSAYRSPNLSLVGVKPGTHTFLINTLSNNGSYGSSPKSASVTLIDPPDGWSLQNTETCDYDDSGEDHYNTELTDYGGDDYLMCSHGSAGLSGTYTSPVYDLGSSGRYLIYILADIVVLGLGDTWNDIIPDDSANPDTTWNDIDISTKTWDEIFNITEGSQIEISLFYGDTDPPTNEIKKMEILSAIATGQYFQIQITITDPSPGINALVENFTLKFCQ